MTGSVSQAAAQEQIDCATVRRDIQRDDSFCLRKGKRGPGNGALLDLDKYKAFRGRAAGPLGLSAEEVVAKIGEALLGTLTEARADMRADVTKEAAAAVLLVAFECCCKRFGKSFRFDEQPEAIRALLREL